MRITTSHRGLVVQAMVVAFVLTIPSATGAKFLVTLIHPLGQASHNAFVGRITGGLVARGHSVTALAADTHSFHGFNKDAAATRIITFKTTEHSSRKEDLAITQQSMSQHDGLVDLVKLFLSVNNIAFENCADMFNDLDTMNDLRKQKFDLLLLEMLVPCDGLLAAYLNVPFIVMTASFRFPAFDEDFYNIEIPSSYVPFDSTGALTDEMSFVQRVQNFLMRHVVGKLIQHVSLKPYRDIQLQHDINTSSSLREIIGRAELWLCHIDFALEFPHPTAPNWIMFAGLMASAETTPLSKELEDFMEGSGDSGVIVFSLGSTEGDLLSEETVENFAQAFNDAPQRVIWKYDGPTPRNLGNNTRLMPWIPQADLLAHPKTKLLVYHGGLAGVYEAMHFKKPMVILPLFADQPAVAIRIAKKGMGVVLSKSTLSVETIKSAIQQVLTNPSYKTNLEKYGSISMDTLTSPMATIMYWIEHVVKFGGSHLKSRAGELSFISRNSLDVLAFTIAVVLLGLYLDFLILRSCYRCFIYGDKPTKSKSD